MPRVRVPMETLRHLREDFRRWREQHPRSKVKFAVRIRPSGLSIFADPYIAFRVDALGRPLPNTREFTFTPKTYPRKRRSTAKPTGARMYVGDTTGETAVGGNLPTVVAGPPATDAATTGPGSAEDPVIAHHAPPPVAAAAEPPASDGDAPCSDCGHDHASGTPCENAECNCGVETGTDDLPGDGA